MAGEGTARYCPPERSCFLSVTASLFHESWESHLCEECGTSARRPAWRRCFLWVHVLGTSSPRAPSRPRSVCCALQVPGLSGAKMGQGHGGEGGPPAPRTLGALTERGQAWALPAPQLMEGPQARLWEVKGRGRTSAGGCHIQTLWLLSRLLVLRHCGKGVCRRALGVL